MVDQYLRSLKKKFNINKKADLETILRDYEVNINEPLENGKYLLHLLITEEDIEGIKLVLSLPESFKSKSANPNIVDAKLGWCPLVTAINKGPTGYQEAIYELLRAKADPNLIVNDLNPIQWASRFNQVEIIKLLQKYGGDVQAANDNGNAMHLACIDDCLETIEYLLSQGLSAKVQNKNGETPLHICAIYGTLNSLTTIIKSYSSKSQQEDEGEDEVEVNEEEVKEQRKELESVLNIQNSLGNTVLHESILAERQTMTEKLRRLGIIDETLVNNEKKTTRDVENTIKEENFRDNVEKQRIITEQRERKKLIQQEKRQRQDQYSREEEQIQRERKKEKEENERDPEADARKFRMFMLLMFIAFLVFVYFLFDFIAKQGSRRLGDL